MLEVRESYETRLSRFMEDFESLGEIQSYISEGGTLSQYCEEHDLRYCDVSVWVGDRLSTAEDVRKRLHMDELLVHLRSIVTSDISQAYHQENGDPKAMNEWPEDLRRSLQSYDVVAKYDSDAGKYTRSAKFRVYDKLKAMEMLGRLYGVWIDRVEHSGDVSVAHRMESAGVRLAEASASGDASE